MLSGYCAQCAVGECQQSQERAEGEMYIFVFNPARDPVARYFDIPFNFSKPVAHVISKQRPSTIFNNLVNRDF